MKNQIPPHQILRVSIACVLAIMALASLPLHAATVTWDGSTDMSWTQPDSTSWTGDTYNSGDTAQFLGAGAGTVTIDAGGVTPAAVIVNSSTNYTFAGEAIGNSGTTTLTKSGTGTLTLSNANTYTGLTTVSGGVLDVGVMGSNAVSSSSGIYLTNTNSILQGSGTFTRALVTGSTPGADQIAGVSGGFAARGGQLTVTFSNNSSAEVTMVSSSGFGSGFAFGSSSADSKVVVENNINLNSSGQRAFSVTAGVGGADATSAELSGVIRNTNATGGGINKRGNGLLILSSTNNSFDGLTSIEAGTVSITSIKNVGGGNSSLGAVTTSDKGRILISSGGTLRYTGTGDTTDRQIFLASTSGTAALDQSGTGLLKFTSNIGGTNANTNSKTFTLQGSTAGTGEISGNILDPAVTGSLAVTKTGAGTWTLSGSNTYSGQTTVTEGVLNVGVIGAGGLSTNSGLFLGATDGATTGIIQGSGTFTNSLSGNTNPMSAQVAGRNGGFAARGGDLTVNLGGAAAQIVMNAGGQIFGQNFVFGSSSADSKVIFANPINLNSTLNAQRIITVNAGIGGAAATSAELQGQISNGTNGANGISKQGAGLLILTGTNTYTGNTSVAGGTLQIGSGGASGSIDSTGAVAISSGATLSFNRSGSLSIGNVISGAGGVRQIGSGTTTLFNTNTYTGNTTVNAGTLTLATNGSLRFVIGGSGTNNSISGTGTTAMNGQFAFDLTSASTNTNATWTIVAGTLTNSYGTNFLVTGFNGAGGNWTNTTNGVNYVFAQSTGVLSVQSTGGVTPYNAWVAYWQTNSAGFTNTAGTDNPDGDTFDNNEEFAFDGNPTIGTGALLTAVKSGTNAVFNYVAMTNTNAVTYAVQFTTNLAAGPWTNATVTISNSANQGGISQTNNYLRKEFVVPATGAEFYRIRANIAP